jgi:uncharacterized LabA/DUF88 family protein
MAAGDCVLRRTPATPRIRDVPEAAWFVDGSYLFKGWQSLHRDDRLDYLRLRQLLEAEYCDGEAGERISDAYYFNADADPPSARQDSFHNALAFPPPRGPGLRVKLYWLQHKDLFWPAKMGGGPVVHPTTGEQYRATQQKAVDVGLAFHLMRSSQRRGWEKLFLAAGDGDFHEVVQHLVEQENVTLFLIGSLDSISEELRPYATGIIELKEVASSVARPRPDASV